MKKNILSSSRDRRRKRIRAKVSGSAERPRLSIYKSNVAMYAQLIDDDKGMTLVASSTLGAKGKNKTEAAKAIGLELAKLAKSKGITKVTFDRGGFIYTGRVQAVAEGAREGGLEF
jgi:large subunit ribosomal protein L18